MLYDFERNLQLIMFYMYMLPCFGGEILGGTWARQRTVVQNVVKGGTLLPNITSSLAFGALILIGEHGALWYLGCWLWLDCDMSACCRMQTVDSGFEHCSLCCFYIYIIISYNSDIERSGCSWRKKVSLESFAGWHVCSWRISCMHQQVWKNRLNRQNKNIRISRNCPFDSSRLFCCSASSLLIFYLE